MVGDWACRNGCWHRTWPDGSSSTMIDPACDRRDHRPATHEIREDLIGYDAAARERILELEAERDGLVAVLRFIVVNQTGVSPVAIARAYLRGGDAEQTSP